MKRVVGILLLPLLAFAGCDTPASTQTDASMLLRLVNATGTVIQVVVGPDTEAFDFRGPEVTADFGEIAVGAQTPHRPINSRFTVTIDGRSINDFYEQAGWVFGISDPPSDRWTLTLHPNHWDLAADL